VPERPKGTGCKPVGSAYGGSNPPAPISQDSTYRTTAICGIRWGEQQRSSLTAGRSHPRTARPRKTVVQNTWSPWQTSRERVLRASAQTLPPRVEGVVHSLPHGKKRTTRRELSTRVRRRVFAVELDRPRHGVGPATRAHPSIACSLFSRVNSGRARWVQARMSRWRDAGLCCLSPGTSRSLIRARCTRPSFLETPGSFGGRRCRRRRCFPSPADLSRDRRAAPNGGQTDSHRVLPRGAA
jgi:hypothetical protein